MHGQRLMAVAAGLALAAGACSGGAQAPPSTVNVDLSEFKVHLDSATAAPGEVAFSVHNGGTIVHEFVVLKTDLATNKLPLADDGTVEEEGSAEIEFLDEVEDLAVGDTATLKVDLAPGRYLLVCNLPDHFKGGMVAAVTVPSD